MHAVIATGIITKFRLQVTGAYHNFYNSISGKLYRAGQVPDDTAMPYATFFFPDIDPERKLSEAWNLVLVQFSIYSDKRSSVEKDGILAYLLTWFDNAEAANGSWAALTVSGYTVVSVDRSNKIDLPYDSEEGENVTIINYLIELKE